MIVATRPMGERAVLAELGSQGAVLALAAALAASPLAGVVDVVPAARTVLVAFEPAAVGAAAVRAWIAAAATAPAPDAAAPAPLVELGVRYDGPDLADTAAALGVSADELVARHRDTAWTVAFTGFAPGFGYLVSDDWPFDVPRLAAPRTRVPAGAVGLAGGFSGAYPRDTPGGWRLIATTDATLFDPSRDEPALLAPGTRVRFVDADAPRRNTARRLDAPGAEPPPPARRPGERSSDEASEDAARRAIRVLSPGLSATVQDLGRPGRAALGVARSGALDRGALRLANRLVGNAEGAAGVEALLGGFRAVTLADSWVAITGARGAATIDGRPADRDTALFWPAGTELALEPFIAGARAYLAVRGGVDVPLSVGSRATDTLARRGPAPLAAGTVLAVGGEPPHPVPAVDVVPTAAPGDVVEVELAPGPRADWFTAASSRALFEAVWTVSNDADRVGLRLDGGALERVRTDELASEGMVPGAVQVPPDGRPTVLLADGPVTGGYPVIAVATDAALDALAQARPGTGVRFRHARAVS